MTILKSLWNRGDKAGEGKSKQSFITFGQFPGLRGLFDTDPTSETSNRSMLTFRRCNVAYYALNIMCQDEHELLASRIASLPRQTDTDNTTHPVRPGPRGNKMGVDEYVNDSITPNSTTESQ